MSTQTSKFNVPEAKEFFSYISTDTIKILRSLGCIVSFHGGDHHNDLDVIEVTSSTSTVAEVIEKAARDGNCCEFNPKSFKILMELQNLGCTISIESGNTYFYKVNFNY